MDYAITTYGGGDILWGVFNALATLLNANTGSLFTSLVRLGLLIGGFGAIMSALWKQNPLALFKDWLLPFYIILNVLFVPTTSVWIIDPLLKTQEKVDHVPWALGAFAGTVSEIGHVLTQKVESVFSLPDDLKYQKNGTLFAARLIQNARELQITNEDTRQNIREFVGQCVVYDAMLGSKYSLDDLKNSSDIWGLVSTNASPVRSFVYKDPKENGSSRAVPQPRPDIITCRQGVVKFNSLWKQEIHTAATQAGKRFFPKADNAFAKRELLQHMPLAMGYLLKSAGNAEEIIKQQMMIHALVDGIEHKSTQLGNAPNFAARRAYLQQRTTYQTLGELAAESLPIMKNVLEALAYAAFLFVIPLSLLPMGWRIISSWAGVVMWIQMWAPLYAVLNFIMTLTAQSRNIGHVGTADGITLANSLGFLNLNADMSAMAGYLAMSIPFISWALIKGGVGAFVRLASHLGNITQGAASRAAEEVTTGNYSFGNLSMGNQHLNTLQAHQLNRLSSYQGGGFRQSDGRVDQLTSASGSTLLNVASTQLPSSVTATESDTNMLSKQASIHAQAAENYSTAASLATAEAYRSAHDLAMHQSRGTSVSSGLSSSESAQWGKAADTMRNITENFAQQHGLDSSQSSRILASVSAGLPFKKFSEMLGISPSLGAEMASDAKRQEAYNHAKAISQSSDYKESLNTLTSYAKDIRFGDQDEASRKYAESISASLDKSHQYRSEESRALQKATSFNEAASWVTQNGTSITQNLNQEYVEWLTQQSLNGRGGPMGREGAIEIVANQPEANHMMQQKFLQQRSAQIESYFANQDIQSVDDIKQAFVQKPQFGRDMESLQQQGQAQGFGEGFMSQEDTRNIIESKLTDAGTQIEQSQQRVDQSRAQLKDHISEGQDANVLTKPWTGVAKTMISRKDKDL